MSTPSKAREHLGTRDGAEAAFYIGDHKASEQPAPSLRQFQDAAELVPLKILAKCWSTFSRMGRGGRTGSLRPCERRQ